MLYDHTEYTRNRAFQTLRASLWDHVANGYLLKEDVEELMGRIGVTHTLEETLEQSEFIFESVFEDATLKRDLFNQMCEILKGKQVPPEKVTLCSNTMALPMQTIVEDIQCKEYRCAVTSLRSSRTPAAAGLHAEKAGRPFAARSRFACCRARRRRHC